MRLAFSFERDLYFLVFTPLIYILPAIKSHKHLIPALLTPVNFDIGIRIRWILRRIVECVYGNNLGATWHAQWLHQFVGELPVKVIARYGGSSSDVVGIARISTRLRPVSRANVVVRSQFMSLGTLIV